LALLKIRGAKLECSNHTVPAFIGLVQPMFKNYSSSPI